MTTANSGIWKVSAQGSTVKDVVPPTPHGVCHCPERGSLRTLLQLWSHLLLSVSQAFPAPARPLYPRLHGLYHRGWLAQCHQNGSVQGQLPHRRLHLPPAGHPDDIRVSDDNRLCLTCGLGSSFLPCHCPWYQSWLLASAPDLHLRMEPGLVGAHLGTKEARLRVEWGGRDGSVPQMSYSVIAICHLPNHRELLLPLSF